MAGKQYKNTPLERGQRITAIVCLCFLLGCIGGAVAANIGGQSEEANLALFLQEKLADGAQMEFGKVVWKYLKYDLLIWLGGWLSMGVFLSGCICLFRGVSLGFTSAMLMASYGKEGILLTCLGILLQHLLLLPAYLGMTISAIYYLFAWEEEGIRKKSRRQDKKRKRMEYVILLCVSLLFILADSGVETLLSPVVLRYFTQV